MATIPGALDIAILARLRGTESLTGDLLACQVITSAYEWRKGSMRKNGTVPCGLFYSDSGVDAMPAAPDMGILEYSVRRFEIWNKTPDGSFFATLPDALEYLLDFRRGNSLLNITGDGLVKDHSLMVSFQGPYFDDQINAFYGLMSFMFVESRP